MQLSIGNRSDANTRRQAYLQAWTNNRAGRFGMRRQTLGRNEAYNPSPNRTLLQGRSREASLVYNMYTWFELDTQ
jgi:hypothetical protein